MLLETCLAIALGFLIVDVVSRCILYAVRRKNTEEKISSDSSRNKLRIL